MRSDETMYGSMPVGRLFLRIAVPGMISMLVWSVCSIADGVFVGNVLGADALAAVNIAWPVITVATAVSDMIASGSSVRISMHLGNRNESEARIIFTRSVLMTLGFSLAFMLVGTLLSGPVMGVLGADGHIAEMGAGYLAVFALFAPVSLLFFATDNYLRICGKVNLSMWINVLVAVLNIVLDALFLLVLHWDVWSAALATSLAMCVGAVISLVPFLRKYLVLRFVKGRMAPGTTRNILYNGSSTFFNSISGAVYMMFANWMLILVSGTDAVSAYGIMMYVNSVAISLFMGMAVSVQPALSYNHGSGDGVRVRDMCRVLTIASVLLAAAMFVAIEVFNTPLVHAFLGGNDPDVAVMAVHGMAIFTFSYLLSWVAVNVNQILTSVDRPRSSLIVGVLSQAVIPIGVMAAMSPLGLDGIWWSMVVSAVLSAAVSVVTMARVSRDGVFRMHDPIEGWVSQTP